MAQKTGALIFDETADRYDIRFDIADYYGGLHCGECIQENTGREILKRGGSTTVSKRGNIGRRKRRRLPPHCPHHKTE